MGNRAYGCGSFTTGLKTLVGVAVILFLFSASALAESQAPPVALNVPAPVAAPNAEENLVLQIVINSEEMTDFIEGLKQKDKVYLSLKQLSSFLDFPITVDADKKTASGWFINDDNKISVTETMSEVRGNKIAIPPGTLVAKDNDIFVETGLLEKWFPLNFSVDWQIMALHITAREKLPFQEALWRKKLHEKLSQQKEAAKDTNLKIIKEAYEAAQWPSVDLTFSPSYQNNAAGATGNYSALAVGDFGYLTSKLYMAGDLANNYLTDMRLTFGRDDYERKLLGFANASSFSFGDINSVGLSQATTSGLGRGFTMTNRALDRPDKFDVTTFIGDSKPGWEVELYRNDALISFQTVSSNGRYEFIDIPILFGNNVFRLAFYGPQGQRDEIIKTINADSSLLEKGTFTYNVSIDQKSQSLFSVADTATNKTNFPRMVGEMEYGVTRWLTATVGSAHTSINNVEHTYATTGLHSSFMGLLTSLEGAYDTINSSYSSRLSVSTSRADTDIRLQQTVAKNFVSEANTSAIARQTDVGISRSIKVPFLGSFGNNLLFSRKVYETSRRENSINYTLSKSFLGMSLTNTLQYDRDNLGLNKLNGIITLHGSLKTFELDAQADYDVTPVNQMKKIRLTALFPVKTGITNTTTLTDTLADSKVVQLEDTVTFDKEHYKLSLTGRGDTKKSYYVGVSVNTAIGKVPGTTAWIASSQSLASTGTIAVRPFLDRNYNQQFDPDETLVLAAAIKVGAKSPTLNEKNILIATQMPLNIPVNIRLDLEQQNDPFRIDQKVNPNLIATTYRVTPRAGKVTMIDFPLFETSQIDGTVHVPQGINPASLQVSLVTTEGQVVGSTHTAFDGYYLMEGIMPGAYKVRVSDDKLAVNHLKQPGDRVLEIKAADIYTQDITLENDVSVPGQVQ